MVLGKSLEHCRKGQKGDVAGVLDGRGKAALGRRASAGEPAGNDFAALGDKLREQAHIFVVDGVNFFHAEFANFLAAEELTAAAFAAPATRTAGAAPFTLSFPSAFAFLRLWCLWCCLYFVCHMFSQFLSKSLLGLLFTLAEPAQPLAVEDAACSVSQNRAALKPSPAHCPLRRQLLVPAPDPHLPPPPPPDCA